MMNASAPAMLETFREHPRRNRKWKWTAGRAGARAKT